MRTAQLSILALVLCFLTLSSSAVVFDGEFARLTISDAGTVASICEKPSGRELCGAASPVMTVVLNSNKRGNARSFTKIPSADNLYELGFTGIEGSVTLAVEPFRGGWTFRVEETAIDGLHAILFFCLRPVCRTYAGSRISGVSDDESGVVLRAYRTDGTHASPGSALQVTYLSSRPLVGAAVGLAAGARDSIPEMMRGMTIAADVPHSTSGGGWSLDSDDNQRSYLFASAAAVDSMDDLLALAERTGVGRLHFLNFWDQYGWYAIDTNKYPRGLADLRACSLKAKAAGLKTSIHNLSGCIGRSAPWLKTEMADGLRVCHTYTLAEPIPAAGDVDEIVVNERPEDDHGYDFATWSRGNTIRIDGEMFQYSEISREEPYAFRKIQRACFGTTNRAHAVGAKADYLWCFYGSFLADPGTPIAEAIADRYARIYAGGDFDGMYNDGLDGYGRWPIPCAVFAHTFYGRCARTGKAPQYEDSIWTTQNWWFHSMVGSWDSASWSPKTFVDRHIDESLQNARLANFQQMTLGWWPVVVGSSLTFGYMRDDVEYFGAKVAGCGCGFSLKPGYSRGIAISYGALAQLTILGWYERLRTSGAFRPELLPLFREKGRDFRLVQDADGEWKVRPVEVSKHHMVSPADRSWRVAAQAAAPAAVRVRPLDGGTAWDGANTLTVLSASMADELAVSSTAGVTGTIATDTSDYGSTLRLTVTNASAAPNGSWAYAERTIPRPFLNLYTGVGKAKGTSLAIGVWIKGDGSGADVNLQLHSPEDVNNARSEHHVKLDFTGWRYFTFSIWREHLPEISERYGWPYLTGAAYTVYERSLACDTVEYVRLWMNGIGKGRTATVEISDLRVMPEKPQSLKAASVTIGGTRYDVPFDLASGEYAELEDGYWTRYSLGCVPRYREPATGAPQLAAGTNEVSFACSDDSARAQVTILALGEKRPALVGDWTAKAHKAMAYEGDYPRYFAPTLNMTDLAPCVIRPGERARISYELFGPISDPALTVGGETIRIGRDVKANEVVRGEFSGTFAGSVPVSMTTSAAGKTAAYLALAKRYVAGSVSVAAGETLVLPPHGLCVTGGVTIASGATLAGTGTVYVADLSALQVSPDATIDPGITFASCADDQSLALKLPEIATESTLPGDPAFWVDLSKESTLELVELDSSQWVTVGTKYSEAADFIHTFKQGVYRINDVRKQTEDDKYLFSTNCAGSAPTAHMPLWLWDKRKNLHHAYFKGNCRAGGNTTASPTNTDAHAWSKPIANIRLVFEVYGGDGTDSAVAGSMPFLGATSFNRLQTVLPEDAVFTGNGANIWGRYAASRGFFSWATKAMQAGEFHVNGTAMDPATDQVKPPYGSPLVWGDGQTHKWRCHPMVVDFAIPDLCDAKGKREAHIADAYTFQPTYSSAVYKGDTANERKRLFELIVYTNMLTKSEIVSVRRYLMRKWLSQDASVTVRDCNPNRLGAAHGRFAVAAGSGLYAESVMDGQTFTKTGAGTCYIENAVAPEASVAVAGGTLQVRSFDFSKPALTEDDLVTVHLDASDTDNFTFSYDPARGVNTVTKWRDVKATSGAANDFSIWQSASTNKPFIAENALNGHAVLDFGKFYEFATSAGTDIARSAAAMRPQTLVFDNHAVIAVWGSANGGGTLLGEVGTYWSNGKGLARYLPTYGAAAGDRISMTESHQSFGNASSFLSRLNGVRIDPTTTGLSGGYDLFSHVAWCQFELNALQAMDNDSRQWLGGGQIGELIVLRMAPSAMHLDELEAYFRKKWFNVETPGYQEATLGKVSVSSGATLEVTGGGPLHVGALASAGGTVKGAVDLLADAELTVTVNDDGSVTPLAIDGSLDLAKGGTVKFAGATEKVRKGPHVLIRGVGNVSAANWAVDTSNLRKEPRRTSQLYVADGNLCLRFSVATTFTIR